MGCMIHLGQFERNIILLIFFAVSLSYFKLCFAILQAIRSLADDLLRRALCVAWKRNSNRCVKCYWNHIVGLLDCKGSRVLAAAACYLDNARYIRVLQMRHQSMVCGNIYIQGLL
jgi:hypothetical protein